MFNFRSRLGLLIVMLLVATIPGAALAEAAGPYVWSAAVLRVTPAKVGSAYIRLENPTNRDDMLQGANAPWAGRIEMHEVTSHDGIMDMHPVKDMKLPAKGALILQNGGLHLMIFDIKEQLNPGDKRDITLQFQKAGALTIPFIVQPLGSAPAAPPHHMHDMPGM